MPIRYDIEPRWDLFYMAGFGLCTGQGFVDANLAAIQEACRRPGQKMLLDLRAVSALSIVPQEMDTIVEMDRTLAAEGVYGDYRTAVLARGEGAVETIISALYNARLRREGLGVEVFLSLEEALAWLGLPEAEREIEGLRQRLEQTD